MTVDFMLGIALAVVATAVLVWSITYFRLRRRVRELEQENSRLQGEIEVRMKTWREREELRRQFTEQFSHLASRALERNKQHFLHRARQNPRQYREGAGAEPSKRGQAVESTVRPIREALLRDKVRQLAGKAYWSQCHNSPGFVVLLLPGEHFLGAALDIDPDLQEEALRRKVILATPNNRVALLKTIASGWRQQALAENAVTMRQESTRLYERMVNFNEYLAKRGKNLRQSVDSCNRAVGSLEHNPLPATRRLTGMGIQPNKGLKDPEQIGVTTQVVTRARDPGGVADAATDGVGSSAGHGRG